MNLYRLLQQREGQGKPLRVGLIGAGKFAAMYLAQVPKTPGVHVAGIADLSPANAQTNLSRVGWKAEVFGAASLDAALKERRTHVGDDWQALVSHPAIDIIVEATGNPVAAIEHVLAAFAHGKHVVMVTVEGRRAVRPAAREEGRGGRRGVQPRLRRPAGADLRPRRLGARGRLRRGCRGARAQVAAAFRAVDAGDGVGALRSDARAGEGRWAESEDVQFLPRRLEAVDRDAPRCATRPA